MAKAKKAKPFSRWRVLAQDGSRRVELNAMNGSWPQFDELVVADAIHLEVMSNRDLWIGIGDVALNVRVKRDGEVEVMLTDGIYDEKTGRIL